MATFDDIVKKLIEQSTAPNPVSYGRLNAQKQEDDEKEQEDREEEGELMTHMKQKGLIPKGSKPLTIFSGTREKR